MRPLGSTGLNVSRIGLGAMPLSTGSSLPTTDAEALLDLALDRGVTFLDTADTYCTGPEALHHNEQLIARVLTRRLSSAVVATKGGTLRTPTGWEIDGHPDRLYAAIVASYAALGGREPIPLWQHHWPDPRYSITAMLRSVRRAVDEGLVRFVGVGNYTRAQLHEACDVLPITTLQNQYNFWHREAETDGLLAECAAQHITFLPWRPLGGPGLSDRLSEIVPLQGIANERGVSPQRLTIAWQLAQSPCILPIPGTRRREHLLDSLAAAELVLEPRELERLNAIRTEELPRRQREAAWQAHPPLSAPRD